MSDIAEPKKRGRPPLGKKAMTPAQRKARQRTKPVTAPGGPTKEKFCANIIRDQIPYFVTSHIINQTTWRPEYRQFWEALGIFADESRKQAEDWFFSERLAKVIRDKSRKSEEQKMRL